jgi:hypothetical protein
MLSRWRLIRVGSRRPRGHLPASGLRRAAIRATQGDGADAVTRHNAFLRMGQDCELALRPVLDSARTQAGGCGREWLTGRPSSPRRVGLPLIALVRPIPEASSFPLQSTFTRAG